MYEVACATGCWVQLSLPKPLKKRLSAWAALELSDAAASLSAPPARWALDEVRERLRRMRFHRSRRCPDWQ